MCVSVALGIGSQKRRKPAGYFHSKFDDPSLSFIIGDVLSAVFINYSESESRFVVPAASLGCYPPCFPVNKLLHIPLTMIKM